MRRIESFNESIKHVKAFAQIREAELRAKCHWDESGKSYHWKNNNEHEVGVDKLESEKQVCPAEKGFKAKADPVKCITVSEASGAARSFKIANGCKYPIVLRLTINLADGLCLNKAGYLDAAGEEQSSELMEDLTQAPTVAGACWDDDATCPERLHGIPPNCAAD